MRKQLSSFILMVCGIIALVVGFTTLPSPAIVSAQPPQPSPRPPILPTADLNQDEPGPTAVVPGRLTGTVIDLRTGAPMPGIAVIVGRQTLYTDANGNYDVWLESGYYRLDLGLTSNQGTPIQPAQAIAVGPGDTVVVHLFLTSPAPTVLPTLTPAAATIVAPLKHLPDTSVAHEPVASGGSSRIVRERQFARPPAAHRRAGELWLARHVDPPRRAPARAKPGDPAGPTPAPAPTSGPQPPRQVRHPCRATRR